MDRDEFYRLKARYFEGETSTKEERLLLKEALRLEGSDSAADEVIWVMGMSRIPDMKQAHSRRRIKLLRPAVAAAAIALVAAGLTVVIRTVAIQSESECYAYVGGERIDSRHEIDALMKAQLLEVTEAGENIEKEISDDLDDMREALKLDKL